MKKAAKDLVEKLKEAERQAELCRVEWAVMEERQRQQKDRTLVQQSINDSRSHLRQIIQAWGDVLNIERFFMEIQERASLLAAVERDAVIERLKLARDFMSTQDPLDFFRGWKTPLERYTPLSVSKSASVTTGIHPSDPEPED